MRDTVNAIKDIGPNDLVVYVDVVGEKAVPMELTLEEAKRKKNLLHDIEREMGRIVEADKTADNVRHHTKHGTFFNDPEFLRRRDINGKLMKMDAGEKLKTTEVEYNRIVGKLVDPKDFPHDSLKLGAILPLRVEAKKIH